MDLEKEIPELVQLSDIRRDCTRWRDQGRKGLERFLSKKRDDGIEWTENLDVGDRALIIKALSYPTVDRKVIDEQVSKLKDLRAPDIIGHGQGSMLFDPASDRVPYLDAARALAALTSAPNGGFATATMHFYYLVVRELYYATWPEWSVGGARAGPGGPPSAFITGEFVRGILSFARTLRRTGEYAYVLAGLENATADLREEWRIKAWTTQDQERRNLSLHTTLAQRSWNLAVAMEIPQRIEDVQTVDLVRGGFIRSLRLALKAFSVAQAEIATFREQEEQAGTTIVKRRLVERSAAAHSIAAGAITDAVERATIACALFPEDDITMAAALSGDQRGHLDRLRRRECSDRLRKLGDQFFEAQRTVEKLIRPAVNYLSAVLDRELAKAQAGAGSAVPFEPAELASAAASFGTAKGEWDQDRRLLLAANYLGDAISERGFYVGQPYHVGPDAYFVPAQPPILTAFVKIIENVMSFECSPGVAKSIKAYFANNRREIPQNGATWRWEYSRQEPHSAAYTAGATITLDHFCRALDRRINGSVLKYFTHSWPKKLKLHDLFYPDYGTAQTKSANTKSGLPRRESIALRLERMRAHIAGVPLDDFHGPLNSIVLHGPPGTGKTTLIEALAASAGVPLVEVTPSDIFVRGTDALEERAGAVLKALSLLTDVVILFDEFDPVLAPRGVGATSVFTFLTAGMLPKLKRLYDSAKERRIAYALVTNLVKEIDPAAIRAGRFDAMVGIYPPDLLSRYSRLQLELRAWAPDCAVFDDEDLKRRIAEIVKETAGGPMHELGKPGWFTRPPKPPEPEPADPAEGATKPRRLTKPGTAFAYIFDKNEQIEFPKCEPWNEDLMSPQEQAERKLIESFESAPGADAPTWQVDVWTKLGWPCAEKTSMRNIDPQAAVLLSTKVLSRPPIAKTVPPKRRPKEKQTAR